MSTQGQCDSDSDGQDGCTIEVFCNRIKKSIAEVEVDGDASVGQFHSRLAEVLGVSAEEVSRTFQNFEIQNEKYQKINLKKTTIKSRLLIY